MEPNLDAWLACFAHRAAYPPPSPDGLEDALPPAERARIGRSLAVFQLGEQSEGRTLLALARRHAARHGRPQLVRITECFIREEQRHAEMLGRYLDDHGIPRRRHDWTDTIFRLLRRMMGFELAVTVLITAELIGIQFYRAVMVGTDSKRLRALCSLFLQDEALHVAYQSELLQALRARRPAPVRHLGTAAHAALHLGAALVVWCEHREVLRTTNRSVVEFLRTCASHYALYFVAPPMRTAYWT